MKRAAVFFADGFEEVEALTVVDYLRRAGVEVDTVSTTNAKTCTGAHSIIVGMDRGIESIQGVEEYDAYIIPGGGKSSDTMKKNAEVLRLLKKANEQKKLIASICAGPKVLHEAGVLDKRKCTSYPGVLADLEGDFLYLEENVVVDNNIITSRGPAITVYFALAIIEYLCGVEKRQSIAKEVLVNLL